MPKDLRGILPQSQARFSFTTFGGDHTVEAPTLQAAINRLQHENPETGPHDWFLVTGIGHVERLDKVMVKLDLTSPFQLNAA